MIFDSFTEAWETLTDPSVELWNTHACMPCSAFFTTSQIQVLFLIKTSYDSNVKYNFLFVCGVILISGLVSMRYEGIFQQFSQ